MHVLKGYYTTQMFLFVNLMFEINRLLDDQDRKNQYYYWKLAIPSVKNLDHSNFLFARVDKCCQNFLTPAILKMQRDEINQSLYYVANLVNQQDIITIDNEFLEDVVDQTRPCPK
jgi:hypothetical protein